MAENLDENLRGPAGPEVGTQGSVRRPYQETFDVYVGRIPPDWNEEKLLEIFSPFGEIMSVDLRRGQEFFNGNQIAFVRYALEESAKSAVESLAGFQHERGTLQINMGRKVKNKDKGNLDFNQSKKTYSELKRTNQLDLRRGKPRQFGRHDNEYGGGYAAFPRSSFSHGPPSHGFKKDWNTTMETTKIREEVILVTEVESPVRFWGQVAKQTVAHNLAKISEELQSYCPTGLKVAENSYQKTKIYGGLYPVDNLWYRCSIVKFHAQDAVTVRYIDFGNTDTIKKETLVELPPSLADGRPFAQLYHLDNCVVTTDPAANAMTYALGVEQLKNLLLGKLVNAKTLSENSHGGANVLVTFPNDTGKSINDLMLEGGCVETIKPRGDRGRIEKSVAEKPLNEECKGSSTESPRKDKMVLKQELDNLKLTVKFQAETICNLNKLFETVKQQNEDLCSELNQAIKMKTILSAVTDLRQSRCTSTSGEDRTSNIDLAISLVADSEHRLTLNKVESYSKLSFSSDALKLAQDSLRTCDDKEKLKELVEHRNLARQEVFDNTKIFLEEVSSLNVNERTQKLEDVLKKLSVFHQRYDGDEQLLEEAVKNYKEWKGKPQESGVKTVRQTTDVISKKLAEEFKKLEKMLDPDSSSTLEDCGTIDINSLATQFSAAVVAEVQQQTQDGDDTEGVKITAALIKCLKKELQREIADVRQLRLRAEECVRVQDVLKRCLDNEPDLSKIIEVRKNLKNVKSRFRHKLADKKDLDESDEKVNEKELQQVEKDLSDLRAELHALLVEEKTSLETLAEEGIENFPELLVQYPEFGLQKFMASNGLIKQGWELSYYSHGEMENVVTSSQGEVALVTQFNGEKCLLKEFSLEEITDIESFETRATVYSRIQHPNLMKIQAIFYDKTHRKAFIQLPYYERSLKKWLESKPSDKAKRDVICDIIRALSALHKAGITHGSVVIENIYVDDNNRGILGEYRFIHDTQQRVSSTAEELLRHSAPVFCDTSPVFDMFCLGEIAWVGFLGDDEAVPRDLISLQKHSQSKAISTLLIFLLALNGGVRPTSQQVTQHPFFTDDNYFDQEQKSKQNPPEESGEKSLQEETTHPEEIIHGDEESPLPEDNQPEEGPLAGENTIPHTLPTESIVVSEHDTPPPDNITLLEQSTLPEQDTLPNENPLLEVQPISEEKSTSGEVIPGESSVFEEALPEEYAATARNPLLNGNGVDVAGEVNGSLSVTDGNNQLENEADIGGTQGQ